MHLGYLKRSGHALENEFDSLCSVSVLTANLMLASRLTVGVSSKLLIPELREDTTVSLPILLPHPCIPRVSWLSYAAPLLSPGCEFITSLTITHVPSIQSARVQEFWPLCRTLGVLDIFGMPLLRLLQIVLIFNSQRRHLVPEDPSLSDRLVRGWSEIPNAFPALKALTPVRRSKSIYRISAVCLQVSRCLRCTVCWAEEHRCIRPERSAHGRAVELQWPTSRDIDSLGKLALSLSAASAPARGMISRLFTEALRRIYGDDNQISGAAGSRTEA